jgi:hypothetical protein
MIMALQHYMLVGFAFVEVNGKGGILITIKTVSGQGNPLSSNIFLIATKPLHTSSCLLFGANALPRRRGHCWPSSICRRQPCPFALETIYLLSKVLSLHDEHATISSLNININKAMALCINIPAPLCELLQRLGMKTTHNVKHLGLHLRKTIDSTVEVTLIKIEPKLIKHEILATTPPTDVLHRAQHSSCPSLQPCMHGTSY